MRRCCLYAGEISCRPAAEKIVCSSKNGPVVNETDISLYYVNSRGVENGEGYFGKITTDFVAVDRHMEETFTNDIYPDIIM